MEIKDDPTLLNILSDVELYNKKILVLMQEMKNVLLQSKQKLISTQDFNFIQLKQLSEFKFFHEYIATKFNNNDCCLFLSKLSFLNFIISIDEKSFLLNTSKLNNIKEIGIILNLYSVPIQSFNNKEFVIYLNRFKSNESKILQINNLQQEFFSNQEFTTILVLLIFLVY